MLNCCTPLRHQAPRRRSRARGCSWSPTSALWWSTARPRQPPAQPSCRDSRSPVTPPTPSGGWEVARQVPHGGAPRGRGRRQAIGFHNRRSAQPVNHTSYPLPLSGGWRLLVVAGVCCGRKRPPQPSACNGLIPKTISQEIVFLPGGELGSSPIIDDAERGGCC
jgi:hypothetical protein